VQQTNNTTSTKIVHSTHNNERTFRVRGAMVNGNGPRQTTFRLLSDKYAG